ncbi:hypothetical protein AF335_03105 [Streptomyces eurocidicus]|uniref:Uncharacterized protein n=1 Tax=Streptomyces eurocidicus TaxID=66423 RepID=A0A2N8P2W4_STREU|nr:hypothetical protein AF335_03105 [Streptomyces eurocidicus]
MFPVFLSTDILAGRPVVTRYPAGALGPGLPPWLLPGVGSAARAAAPWAVTADGSTRAAARAAEAARATGTGSAGDTARRLRRILRNIFAPPYLRSLQRYLNRYHKIPMSEGAER